MSTLLGRRAAFVKRRCREPAPRLLDLGCGDGSFLAVARTVGTRGAGIDRSEYAVGHARQHGLDVVRSDLTSDSFPFSDNSFDIATLWDVIEHVPSPHHVLSEVFRVLKPQGMVALSTPNVTSLVARIGRRRWRFFDYPTYDHIHHFSPDTLERLFRQTGFEVGRLRPERFLILAGVGDNGWIVPRTILRVARRGVNFVFAPDAPLLAIGFTPHLRDWPGHPR